MSINFVVKLLTTSECLLFRAANVRAWEETGVCDYNVSITVSVDA